MQTFFTQHKKNLLVISLLTTSLFGQAQTGFGVKKHKDTTLNKSGVQVAKIINGKASQAHFLFNPPFGSIQQAIAPSFANTTAKNTRTDKNIQVVTSKESGLPLFISTPKETASTRQEGSFDKLAASFAYLEEISAITSISKPIDHFKLCTAFADEKGKTHIKLTQQYKGINIDGAEVIVHLNTSGEGEAFNGRYHVIKKEIDTKPVLSSKEAVEKVIAHVSGKTVYKELTAKEKTLLQYTGPEIDTIVYEEKALIHNYLLAYKIFLRPNVLEEWIYIVEAQAGTIIDFYKNSCHAGPATAIAKDLNGVSRTINTYLDGANYTMIDATKSMYSATDQNGIIITLDANNTTSANFEYKEIQTTNNVWNNPSAISAHYNAGIAFDYYKNVHARNSIDGKGGNIISFINVADEDGSSMDNAYWNGKAMFYGNGKDGFKPLAGGLDVAGHEMTHGVVQNTAALKYQGESGAINESMADIFGVLMDSTDWLIGEDVVKTAVFPSGALRSLSDPHNGGVSLNDQGYQPRIKNEKYNGTEDNGGVHINSGITNWAFYKYASVIGRYKAAKIYYRALTTYLTQSSQFIDLRLAIIQSAKDLYGDTSNEVTQASLAFDAVGITNGTGGTYTSTLPTNPGAEQLLVYDADNANTNGLYRTPTSSAAFVALTDKSLYHKPSITDNGKKAYLIGNDKKMYSLQIDPNTTFSPETFDGTAIWANVAVSKDGKRLAAVTFDQDTSIYVYDFASNQTIRYMLYNPTYTEGVKAAGPVYADALEWDYTGEFLVYDTYNSLKGSGTENIEYWDINFIKVWDNASNDFADGSIFKLFSNLEEGESIGNPTFAKNSPNVIAFDYLNESQGEYGIIGLDIEKNEVQAIASNTTIGWPSYNKTDSRIAYTTSDMNGDYHINVVDLNPDKISPLSLPSTYIELAQWPVYFAFGDRNFTPTGLEDLDLYTESIQVYPNPTSGMINMKLPNLSGELQIEIYNSLGAKVGSQKVLAPQANLDITDLSNGVYTLAIKNGKGSKQIKVIKQ